MHLIPLFLFAGLSRQAPLLEPGMAPPPLRVHQWLKGKPVAQLNQASTYVIYFWAPWSKPCQDTVSHVSDLARRFPPFTFIGVSVWENGKAETAAKFMAARGKEIGFSMADGGSEDTMARTWLAAMGIHQTPVAILVWKGKIAWLGHPNALDPVLAQIQAGTYSAEKFRTDYLSRQALLLKRQSELKARFDGIAACVRLYRDGHKAQAHAKLNALEKGDPHIAFDAEELKFLWLSEEDPAAWKAEAIRKATSPDQSDVADLGTFALHQAGRGNPTLGEKTIKLVLDATHERNVTGLWFATKFYELRKQDRTALGYADKLLAILPTSEVKSDANLKKVVEVERSRIVGRLKSGDS